MAFGYVYDNVGNITQETRDGATTTYVYDHLGQLTRVNDPNDTTSGSSG
ncbi:MAG: RHS repeat protein, partial [Clostridia bacterium]|nr:RHS repeat protein [Clostridia bacterium]